MENRDKDGRFLKGHRIRKPTTAMKIRKESEARVTGELRAKLKMHEKKPIGESIKEHIGHILDNATLTEIAELVAVLGLTFTVHQLIVSTESFMNQAMKIASAPISVAETIAQNANISGLGNEYITALQPWIQALTGYTLPNIPSPDLRFDVTYTVNPSGTQRTEHNVSQVRIDQIKQNNNACPIGFRYVNTSILASYPYWTCQDNTDANHMVPPNSEWYTNVSVTQTNKITTPSGQTGSIDKTVADLQTWLLSFCIAFCIVKYGGQLIGLLTKGLAGDEGIIALMMGL